MGEKYSCGKKSHLASGAPVGELEVLGGCLVSWGVLTAVPFSWYVCALLRLHAPPELTPKPCLLGPLFFT